MIIVESKSNHELHHIIDRENKKKDKTMVFIIYVVNVLSRIEFTKVYLGNYGIMGHNYHPLYILPSMSTFNYANSTKLTFTIV